MLQCVGDEKIQTVHGISSILLKFEVGKVRTKLAPCLEVQGGVLLIEKYVYLHIPRLLMPTWVRG